MAFIKKASDGLEEGADIPSNFCTTLGALFIGQTMSETLWANDMFAYSFLDTQGYKSSGSIRRKAADINIMIIPEWLVPLKEAASMF